MTLPVGKNESEFIRAYITTALWASTDDNGIPLDYEYDENDIHPDSLKRMMEDCLEFLANNGSIIEAAIESNGVKFGPDFGPYGRAGHDFWLTRVGAGCGFWDGDWDEPYGEQLANAAKKMFKAVYLYVSDNGRIHCEGA